MPLTLAMTWHETVRHCMLYGSGVELVLASRVWDCFSGRSPSIEICDAPASVKLHRPRVEEPGAVVPANWSRHSLKRQS